MGGLAEEQVRLAVKGLVERDRDADRRSVLRGDEPINALHIEIDDRCFKLLALHQPMAADLRAIVAAVKINTDLERVGDLAVNIAEAARRYCAHPPVKKLIDIPRMADIAQTMLRDALDAFVRRDIDAGRSRCSNEDDELDALKTQIFRELLTYMLQDPAHHRAGARPDPHLAPPRAHRRPRHQHRRGRHLHRLGADVRHHAGDEPAGLASAAGPRPAPRRHAPPPTTR